MTTQGKVSGRIGLMVGGLAVAYSLVGGLMGCTPMVVRPTVNTPAARVVAFVDEYDAADSGPCVARIIVGEEDYNVACSALSVGAAEGATVTVLASALKRTDGGCTREAR